MMWYGEHMNAWGYGLMAFSTIAFLGLAVAGVIALVRYLSRSEQPAPSPHAPEQILAERFARGEIDEDEYRLRLQTLHAAGQHGPGQRRLLPAAREFGHGRDGLRRRVERALSTELTTGSAR